MTRAYFNLDGELNVADFDEEMSHQEAVAKLAEYNIKPDDNRVIIVIK